ncbi:hypothetical protein ACIBQ1_26655 [Nonomuraea sp. NPDC050153]|uniref:hypothetical protein n=1 Tax=Nonomuraea sp. NPDC050153 TaxID=3364359 RepID=UPI0037A92619
MRAHMTNPAFARPDGMKDSGALFKAVNQGWISPERPEIVGRRTGRSNRRSVCVGTTRT